MMEDISEVKMGTHEKIGFGAALILMAYLAREDIYKKRIPLFAIVISGCSALLFMAAGESLSFMQITVRIFPGVVLLLAAFVTKEAIGYGDGVAVLVLGLWTSIIFCLSAVGIGLFLAGICGVVLLIRGKKKVQIPFIPFLLAAMEVLLIYV